MACVLQPKDAVLNDRTTLLRHRNRFATAEIGAGKTVFIFENRLVRTLKGELAAQRPGPRTKVNDLVGTTHHLRLVLDDDDGVADVAQVLKNPDETVRVARM